MLTGHKVLSRYQKYNTEQVRESSCSLGPYLLVVRVVWINKLVSISNLERKKKITPVDLRGIGEITDMKDGALFVATLIRTAQVPKVLLL